MRAIVALAILCLSTTTAYCQTVVQMEKKDGVYFVPCTVNGLKLKFIFDTGASSVSISLSEAVFMLKNGYMSEDDLIGTERYRIANGDIAEGTEVNLRSITIGGKELRNVKASIVHSTSAPLLLGQSLLERFGNVSINFADKTLILGGNGTTVSSPQNIRPTSSSFSSGNILIDPRDGKEYKTVLIGTQIWMAENLAFRPATGNYWAYDNDPRNVAAFGYLYDWATANKVCPAGWHLPSDSEWTRLTDFLGGEDKAGTKMKSRTGWKDNGNGTDESGFSGLPGGHSFGYVSFHSIGDFGYWWSSSEPYTGGAWNRNLIYNDGSVYRNHGDKSNGFSVRCLRN